MQHAHEVIMYTHSKMYEYIHLYMCMRTYTYMTYKYMHI